MKILIFMEGFFPGKKYGGPPVSINNFCTLLSEHEIFIVATNHDLGDKNPYYELKSNEWINSDNKNIMYLSDEKFCYHTFLKISEEIKPDVLYLQGLFQRCVLPVLLVSKFKNIPVLLAPRGELCQGAFNKKYKKIPYIVGVRILFSKRLFYQATSEEERQSILKYLTNDKNKVYELDNIPSIPTVKYDNKKKKTGSASIVFLSRIHPKKNLSYAISIISKIKDPIHFDIYGPIEDPKYWELCNDQITRLPKNIVVNYKGVIDHTEIHNVFSQYECFIFPTLSENYGHVIAEALTANCPVIISDQTPWTDVNDYGAGWAIPLDNKDNFINAVQAIVSGDEDYMKKLRKNIQVYVEKKLNLQNIKNNYNEVLTFVSSDRRS